MHHPWRRALPPTAGPVACHATKRIPSLLLIAAFSIAFSLGGRAGYAQPSSQASPTTPTPWWQRITFGGDLRLRYEGFFQEQEPARHRARYRLRVTLSAPINDQVRFGLRLGSGHLDDPISLNQDLTDFFIRKPVSVDQVYVVLTPSAVPALTIGAGKFPFPVVRTQLVWDDDINWEGIYEEVRSSTTSRPMSFKLVAVQAPLKESRADDDSLLLAGYGEVTIRAGRHAIQLSVADYGFRELDPLAVAIDAGTLDTTNTNLLKRNAAGRVVGFASRFNLVDVIGQVTLATARAEYPVRLLADWVTNTKAATDEDTGIWLVVTYGRAAVPKTFSLSYTFARIEQEAVLSPYIWSDLRGSNLSLSVLGLAYMPLPRVHLEATAILSTFLVAPATRNDRLTRLMVDARVSF